MKSATQQEGEGGGCKAVTAIAADDYGEEVVL